MAKAVKIALILAGVSLVIGIVSRITMTPIPAARSGLEAEAFLEFTNTCLLAGILFSLLDKKS
ncbi:MAG: hypothetical protein V1739_00785 [Candidatus Omnitrophota bacterium]